MASQSPRLYAHAWPRPAGDTLFSVHVSLDPAETPETPDLEMPRASRALKRQSWIDRRSGAAPLLCERAQKISVRHLLVYPVRPGSPKHTHTHTHSHTHNGAPSNPGACTAGPEGEQRGRSGLLDEQVRDGDVELRVRVQEAEHVRP